MTIVIYKNLTICVIRWDNFIYEYSMTKNLINSARSGYNLIVEIISKLVEEFKDKYRGYKRILGLQVILNTADISGYMNEHNCLACGIFK
jgi:hypothetical protein